MFSTNAQQEKSFSAGYMITKAVTSIPMDIVTSIALGHVPGSDFWMLMSVNSVIAPISQIAYDAASLCPKINKPLVYTALTATALAATIVCCSADTTNGWKFAEILVKTTVAVVPVQVIATIATNKVVDAAVGMFSMFSSGASAETKKNQEMAVNQNSRCQPASV